jgi:hypothetical protein
MYSTGLVQYHQQGLCSCLGFPKPGWHDRSLTPGRELVVVLSYLTVLLLLLHS